MKTILVVDDEETIVEILEIYIEGFFENVKVVTAYGGYEAIDILKEETVDAIICDFRMPEGNGVVVYNYNEENLKLPFAWHSGTFSSDENTFDKQADYFILEKPALDDQLTDLVQKLLEASSISDHLYRKIKPSTLRRIKDINFPVFYKINNEKYVSLIVEGDDKINQTLEKYETKGEEYLYVKKKDLENVYKLKCSELKERIEQCGTVEDVYFVSSEAIEHF
ncbi:MAG: response regulator, partial [Bdellovibrionota bacterium]|nr:response regulator [Bdellovibrionota bacterium]